MFKFIHAADIHLDSPMKGLETKTGAPIDLLRRATRAAFENLVTLAIDERVAFIIIAGDLFDGAWPDVRTAIWAAQNMRKLKDAGITVFLIRGNHDAASVIRKEAPWPDNVHEFSTKKAETRTLQNLGVAIHGRGFDQQSTDEDLAVNYPLAAKGMFNIGILHTSLAGSTEHDSYAPTTLDILRSRGYDYWALGHIHARQLFSEVPHIAYSGNTQGRHIKETGPKGCLLVTVDDGHIAAVDFRETDVFRWFNLDVRLAESDDLAAMHAKVRDAFAKAIDSAEGLPVAARVTVRGACAAHEVLSSAKGRDDAANDLILLAAELSDSLWLERIAFETTAPVMVAQLREGKDLLGDLLRTIDALRTEPDVFGSVGGVFSALLEKHAAELEASGADPRSPENLRRWLDQAEALLVARLAGESQ